MNFSEYVAYFENAARNNRAISHLVNGRKSFRRIDIEEVITGLKSDLDAGINLFLESPEIRAYDGLSDNPRKLITGAILVMRNSEKGDFEDQIKALNDTMEVCEQLLAKIYNDARESLQNKNHPWKLRGFDPNSVSFEKVGPVFGYYYGWRMQFTINQLFPNRLILNNDDWYTEEKSSI